MKTYMENIYMCVSHSDKFNEILNHYYKEQIIKLSPNLNFKEKNTLFNNIECSEEKNNQFVNDLLIKYDLESLYCLAMILYLNSQTIKNPNINAIKLFIISKFIKIRTDVLLQDTTIKYIVEYILDRNSESFKYIVRIQKNIDDYIKIYNHIINLNKHVISMKNHMPKLYSNGYTIMDIIFNNNNQSMSHITKYIIKINKNFGACDKYAYDVNQICESYSEINRLNKQSNIPIDVYSEIDSDVEEHIYFVSMLEQLNLLMNLYLNLNFNVFECDENFVIGNNESDNNKLDKLIFECSKKFFEHSKDELNDNIKKIDTYRENIKENKVSAIISNFELLKSFNLII